MWLPSPFLIEQTARKLSTHPRVQLKGCGFDMLSHNNMSLSLSEAIENILSVCETPKNLHEDWSRYGHAFLAAGLFSHPWNICLFSFTHARTFTQCSYWDLSDWMRPRSPAACSAPYINWEALLRSACLKKLEKKHHCLWTVALLVSGSARETPKDHISVRGELQAEPWSKAFGE